MFVVWDTATGNSDESMRFPTQKEALDYIEVQFVNDENSSFSIREED